MRVTRTVKASFWVVAALLLPTHASGETLLEVYQLASQNDPKFPADLSPGCHRALRAGQGGGQAGRVHAARGGAGHAAAYHAAYLVVLAATDNLALASAEREAVGKVLELARAKLKSGLGTITNQHDALARFSAAQAREIEARTNCAMRARDCAR
jgi:hypothetical protein